MRCFYCGFEFEKEKAAKACESCCCAKGYHMIRCPRCGHEMPEEPLWVTKAAAWIRLWRKKI